mgnify:CR=1 FL=1
MLIILNYKIDILDIFTMLISIIALLSTLRKKEYGKFYFIPKNEKEDPIWIKLIKFDLYDLKFSCEPYTNMNCRIDIIDPETQAQSFWCFPSEIKPTFEIGFLKQNTIIKFTHCKSSKINIEFQDKYNNKYSQILTQNNMSKRLHKNFWNLTFVGN